MSDTPRTDSATFYADTSVTVTELCVTEDFARTLERENAALRELLERCTAYILNHTTDGVVRSQLLKDIEKENGK
jgi:hypothetical protein